MPKTTEDSALLKRRRRRAHRLMQVMSVLCALVALGLGGYQLHSEGLVAFLDRPPGVGATPQQDQPGAARSAPQQPSLISTRRDAPHLPRGAHQPAPHAQSAPATASALGGGCRDGSCGGEQDPPPNHHLAGRVTTG